METRENTISIIVNNKPDVMARIAGTFSGRGFNIETISVNVTEDPQKSKIILTIWGNQETIIKIEKQLNRLMDVIQVDDLTGADAVRREMILIRVKAQDEAEARLRETLAAHGWKMVSSEGGGHIVEISGHREDIEKALAVLKPFGVEDFTRTGTVALARQNNKTRG